MSATWHKDELKRIAETAAVKAAAAKHPKFRVEAPQAVSVSYLIRGFPVPDAIASQVTLGEAQAYASEIAASLGAAHAELLAPKAGGTAEGAVIWLSCGLSVNRLRWNIFTLWCGRHLRVLIKRSRSPVWAPCVEKSRHS